MIFYTRKCYLRRDNISGFCNTHSRSLQYNTQRESSVAFLEQRQTPSSRQFLLLHCSKKENKTKPSKLSNFLKMAIKWRGLLTHKFTTSPVSWPGWRLWFWKPNSKNLFLPHFGSFSSISSLSQKVAIILWLMHFWRFCWTCLFTLPSCLVPAVFTNGRYIWSLPPCP